MSFSYRQPNHCADNVSPLIVLLDIDHTMMEFSYFPSQEAANDYVAKLPTLIKEDQSEERVLIFQKRKSNGKVIHFNLRPGLSKFLQELSNHCELHIYTAGKQFYAEYVAKILGRDCFSKDHLWSRCGGWISTCDRKWHWKEISKLPLGRNGDLSRVVLIDDNVQTLHANPANVYPVSKFSNDPSDNELHNALEFFISKLIPCKDVRQVLWDTNKGTVAKMMEFHSQDTFMRQEPFTSSKEFVREQTKKDNGLSRKVSINSATNSNKKRRREPMASNTNGDSRFHDSWSTFMWQGRSNTWMVETPLLIVEQLLV